MKAHFDDLPAGHWNEAQAVEAMRHIAIDAAEGWGVQLFLVIEEAFAPHASVELHDWAVEVAGATTLNLITQSEGIAAALGLSPEQSRRFIADRVGVCRARLEELGVAFSSRGHA